MNEDDRVIWSFEHTAYWGPGHCGYVEDLESAGCYSKTEADAIVRDANITGTINEIAIHISIATLLEQEIRQTKHTMRQQFFTLLRAEKDRTK